MPQDSSHPLQSRFRRYQQQRHGRHQDRLPCVLCGAQLSLGLEAYTDHFRAQHADVLERELASGGDATAIGRKYYRRSQDPPDAGYVAAEREGGNFFGRGCLWLLSAAWLGRPFLPCAIRLLDLRRRRVMESHARALPAVAYMHTTPPDRWNTDT